MLVSACHHAPVFAPTIDAPPHCPGTTAEHEARIKVLTINLRHDADQWPRRFELAHPSGGVLDFATTHLDQHRGDDGEMARDQETERLLAFFDREDECRPTIRTGDFNSTDKGHALSRLRSARFEDSWAAANGSAAGNTAMIELEPGAFAQHPRRRIDFILARPAGERTLRAVSSEVVFANHDARGFYPSDHFGVFTTFDVRL